MIELNWQEFKQFVDSRNVGTHHVEMDTKYLLFAHDGVLSFRCDIKKDTPEATEYEADYKNVANKKLGDSVKNNPFGAKVLPDGKKLFRRKHGFKSSSVTAGSSGQIILVVPYIQCKINLIEFTSCREDVQVDFSVLDSTTGTYTTVPNHLLNQFGFDVELPDGFYKDKSEYDADLYQGMQIKIVIKNNSMSDFILRGNIVYHEVK